METENGILADEYCPDCGDYGIHFCRNNGFKDFYYEIGVEKNLKEEEPKTLVHCKMCGESYLWGLSWVGSQEGKFVCSNCEEKIELENQPYKEDR